MMEEPVVPDQAESNIHPKSLKNEDPVFLTELFSLGVSFAQSYGWFIVFAAIVCLLFKDKIVDFLSRTRSQIEDTRDRRNYDADTAYRRQVAMDEARRRMQEQHDAKAAHYAEQQKLKEEEKRRERVEDWERHQKGQGYRSKHRTVEESSSTTSNSKPAAKKTYRDNDYNPLMGGGSVSGFRPARRSGGGARGG